MAMWNTDVELVRRAAAELAPGELSDQLADFASRMLDSYDQHIMSTINEVRGRQALDSSEE